MIGKATVVAGVALAAITIAAGLAAVSGGPADTGGGALPVAGAGYGMPGVTCVQSAELRHKSLPGWDAEQTANAATIVAVGAQLNVPVQGQVVAVATAMQESKLRNLDYGDTDSNGKMTSSRGLFQQIAAWGPLDARTDPAKAAAMFYTGGNGGQRGLLDVADWQQMPVTVAAQAVQQSGFPDAYAKWEQPARTMVGYVTDTPCAAATGSDTSQKVIDRVMTQLGVPYAWGGGNADGPTRGIHDGGVADTHGDYMKVGFDCSGLAQYAYAAVGVSVPHQTQAIWAAFDHITDRSQLEPGDLLLYSANGTATGIHHVGIYLGGDKIIEAPQSGEVVKIRNGIFTGLYGKQFIGAVRPEGVINV